ncbi:MAG: toxin-antitoxin system HicB family antitoxin [Thiolinea sp.]
MSELSANKTKVVTLRIPLELKSRLDQQAKLQGVSVNNLANYLLTTQVSQLETLSAIETRLHKSDINELKKRVSSILDKVPGKQPLPEWDRL